MKKMAVIFAVVAAFAFCGSAFAQEVKADEGEKKMTREQLAQAQARRIADELALDDKTAAKFVDTFCSYQQEIWDLGPAKDRPEPNEDEVVTDEAVAKAIEAKFEHSRKILDIREKYYKEYSKFLSPKQIQKVYEQEHRMMNRFSQGRPGRQDQAGRPGQPGKPGRSAQPGKTVQPGKPVKMN